MSINYGDYIVYDDGRVWSNKTNKFLKPFRIGKYRNYLAVRLVIDGIAKDYKIHRLVAQFFIPNPNNLPQVNHIDGDTFNNKVSNLEWCTNQYNQQHAYDNGLHKKYMGKDNANSKKVIQKDMEGNIIKVWDSQSDASRALGIPSGSISRCCLGLKSQTHNYKWEAYEDELT